MINSKILIPILLFISWFAHAQVYDEIIYSNSSCSNSLKPMPVEHVPENISFFKNNMGKWQITRVSDGYVVMGYGYGNSVKKGSAAGIYCVARTEETNTVTYPRISFNHQCPAPSFPLPLKDVDANMNFLRNNMGRWQITSIGDGHVIMGAGYGFAVKPGSTYFKFCAHPQDNSIIRDRATMEKMANNVGFFKQLLATHNNLTVITSNGNNFPGTLELPLGVSKGKKFIVERHSDDRVNIKYAKEHILNHGVYTTIIKGKRLEFYYDGIRWLIKPEYTITNLSEFSDINRVHELILKYRSIKINITDDEWQSELNLPSPGLVTNAKLHGTMVIVERNSNKNVRVKYGPWKKYLDLPNSSSTIFVNHANFWAVQSFKSVTDNHTLRMLGNSQNLMKETIEGYNSLILQTSDGNWTPQLTMPNAEELGTFREIIFRQQSSWGVNLKFPGATIKPRYGVYIRFGTDSEDQWIFYGAKSIYSASDMTLVDSADKLKRMLDIYGSLSIYPSEDGHRQNIYLPDNARNGDMLKFRRKTDKPVVIHFSNQEIRPRWSQEIIFYFSNDSWSTVNLN